jgi:hypothetical protein
LAFRIGVLFHSLPFLSRRLNAKSSAGSVARAFIASGLEQMRAQYPDLKKFLEQQITQNEGEQPPVEKKKTQTKSIKTNKN